MANKILSFQKTDSKITSKKEVYLDLNMNSKVTQDSDTGKMKYSVDKSVNIDAVMNSLRNIFTWIPGERVINPEFGSKLRKLLYEGITEETRQRVVQEIRMSVSIWEPRVSITDIINISTIEDTEDNTIRLDIKFTVEGLEGVYDYEYVQNNPK